jgi:mono/diheme cytochrome c family protein
MMFPRDGWTRAVSAPGIVLMVSMLWAAPLSAQEIRLPAAITVGQVEQGLHLFHTKGACQTCHGELGIGTADGPQLLVGQWKLGPGTFDWLRHITRHAGWGATSRAGDPKPMRGPTVLDTAEVSAVAAYVWNISRARAPAPERP